MHDENRLGLRITLVPQKLRYSTDIWYIDIYIDGIESNKRRVYRNFSYWNGHEVFGESLMVWTRLYSSTQSIPVPNGLMSKFMALQTQLLHPTWGSCASSPSSSYGMLWEAGNFRLSCEKKAYSIEKKSWAGRHVRCPFFLHRRGHMNGLLHLWRFSSLKRAQKRLWERTFGPACPWKGTRWHRSLAKACPPVIKHVWVILVKNWEHHLNCIKSLGCHFLVPDYPLELDYFHCHVTMFISQSRRYWIASSSFQVCLTGMPRTAWTRVGFHQDHQALKPGKNMSDQLSHPKFTCFIMFFTVSVHVISVIYPNISQQTQLQLWPSSAGNPLWDALNCLFQNLSGMNQHEHEPRAKQQWSNMLFCFQMNMLLQTAHFHGEMNLDNKLKLQMVPITIKMY